MGPPTARRRQGEINANALALLNHLLDPFKLPVNLPACDHKRRSDTDDPIVRLLAKNPLFLEGFAIRTRRALQLNPNPQADAAHLAQVAIVQGLEFFQEVSAQFRGALNHFFFDEHAQRSSCNSAAQRVSAERAAMITRLKYAQNFLRREHAR